MGEPVQVPVLPGLCAEATLPSSSSGIVVATVFIPEKGKNMP